MADASAGGDPLGPGEVTMSRGDPDNGRIGVNGVPPGGLNALNGEISAKARDAHAGETEIAMEASPLNPTGDLSLVPTDSKEIVSWYMYDCASSPVAATVVTFWALLVTGYAKSRAATRHDEVEWRENYAGGEVCYGECSLSAVNATTNTAYTTTTACSAYDSSVYGADLKFERPDGMPGSCEWFPKNPKIPGSQLDFGAVVVYCNFTSQLACGAFLVLFGSLGDFGGYRKKGLKLGWFLFSVAPLVAGVVSPGDVNGDDTNSMKFALFIAALLFVVTNISHLAAQQMFDAYLPLLAQTHPEVQQTLGMIPADKDGKKHKKGNDFFWRCCISVSPPAFTITGKGLEQLQLGGFQLTGDKASTTNSDTESVVSESDSWLSYQVAKARQNAASELALRAPALGFVSILFITCVQLGCVLGAGDDNRLKGLRWTLLVVGAWGGGMGFLALRGIRVRPRQSLLGDESKDKEKESSTSHSKASFLATIATLGTRRTLLSVKMLQTHHPEMLKLLIGQIFSTITNGTMLSSYTLYCQRELGATATDLVILVFSASVAAFISTASFSAIAVKLTEKQLKWCLVFFKTMTLFWPLWMCFGFKQKIEMVLLPIVASPFNANILPTLRSIFQQATPRGYEAALFSLCGVCTVAFTWIGSLIMGGILALTGSMRWGFLAIDVFVFFSLRFFGTFDPEKAREDRKKIEKGEFDQGGVFLNLRSDGR